MIKRELTFTSPSILPQSPYTQGEIIRLPERMKEVSIPMPDLSRAFIPQNEVHSPFKSAVEYEEENGMRLITLLPELKSAKTPPAIIDTFALSSDDKFMQRVDGLWCYVNGTEKRICNFFIRIREIIVRKKYYGSERIFISFDIATSNKILEEAEMPLSEYKKMLYKLTNEYPQLFVDPQFNNAANYFLEYTSMIYSEALDRLKKRVIYEYHGWADINGKKFFLSKALPYCDTECYVPKINQKRAAQIYLYGQSFLNIGKSDLTDEGTVDLKSTLKQILPIFIYAHAGYTAMLFKEAGLELQFVLALIGRTGSFKTSISKVIFELFNTKPMLNFQSTPRAIELYRDSCRDMTMVLDDIFSCKDQDSMEKFEKILRCFGDGIAKAKSDITTNKIEQFDVRGGCVITAENDLARQQSSHLRYLTVHVDNNSFSGEELKKWQQDELLAKRNNSCSKLQEYFSLYIHYLSSNFDDVVNQIMNFDPPDLKLDFPRLQSNYKCMAVLARIIIDCGIYSLALLPHDAEYTYEQWIEVIQEIVLENQRYSKISEPYKLFAYAINQGLGTGAVILAADKKQYSSDNSNGYWGYIDLHAGLYMLNPDKCFEFVERFYQKKGGSFQASDTAVYREFLENEISVGYQEASKKKTGELTTRRRYLKKVQVNGITTSMLAVYINKLNELIDNFE